MLHLTHFSTNCSAVQKLSASFVSLPTRHTSIHHSQNGGGREAGRRVGKYVHTPTKKKKKVQTLAITSPLMHFTSGHANATTEPQEENPTATLISTRKALNAHPQKSAHPESTQRSYEHFISQHKHFIPDGSCHIQVLILENGRDYG